MTTDRNRSALAARWLLVPLALVAALFYLLADAPSADAGQDEDRRDVCVVKTLSDAAVAAGAAPSDVIFRLDVEGINGPFGDPISGGTDQTCFEEFVIEGETVTVSELPAPLATVSLVVTDIDCGQPGQVENLAAGSIEFVVDPQSPELITCTFTNDIENFVCVRKDVSQDAIALGAAPTQYQFTISYDGEQQVASPAGPGTFYPRCNQTSDAETDYVEFILPPGVLTFTISEGAGTIPEVGPRLASCSYEPVDGGPLVVVDADAASPGAVTMAANAPLGGRIDCDFENETVEVCVVKIIGNTALDAGLGPLGVGFTVKVTPPGGVEATLPTVVTSEAGNAACNVSNSSRAAVAVNVPPGSTVKVSEAPAETADQFAAQAQAGLSSEPFCVGGEESSEESGEVTVEAGTSTTIDCTFINDSIRICAQKQIGPVALESLNPVPSPTAFSFEYRTQMTLVDTALVSQTVTDDLACEASVEDGLGYAEFFVAPGQQFSLTEIGDAGPLGLLDVDCSGLAIDGSTELETEAIVVGNTATATAPSAEDIGEGGFETIVCTFTNDTVRVCAIKDVGPTAFDDVGFTAGGATFTLTQEGEPAQQGAPIIAGDDAVCDEVPVADGAAVEFFIKPGSRFTLSESVDDSRVGLVDEPRCFYFGEVSVGTVDVGGESITATHLEGSEIKCFFDNDSARVCVRKIVDENAQAAGLMPADFEISITSRGVTQMATPAEASDSCDQGPAEGLGVVEFFVAPGAEFALSEAIPEGAPAALIRGGCYDIPASPDEIANVSINSQAEVEGGTVNCFLLNDSAEITINKTVVNDNGGSADASAFIFNVFDESGNLVASGPDPDGASSEVGLVAYVAPGSTFTVTELPTEGYELTVSECAAPAREEEERAEQALAADSLTVELPDGAREYGCSFTNDDIAMVPVCAMLTLVVEADDTEFELANFGFELFDNGGSSFGVQRSAGDPADLACAINAASLTPAGTYQGELVRLGAVLPATGPYTFSLVTPADPDNRLVVGTGSCSLNPGVGSTQAIETPGAATFSTLADSVLAVCEATVTIPVVTETGGLQVFGSPLPLPVPEAAAVAAPAVQPVAVVQQQPLAVTGSSTTTSTVPLGFAALGLGFVFMGLDARTRWRFRQN